MSRLAEIQGCLLGTAVGDAFGLPCEGLSARRQRRMHPELCGHRFFFGKGMVSDDTEHSCMVAQSLVVSAGDPDRFVRSLSWRLRFWLLGLPAGVGFATLRAILKLWLGFSGRSSGVFSAGNGPAMRSAVVGACWEDAGQIRSLVSALTRITHTDPKAEQAALAVALAANSAGRKADVSPDEYCRKLEESLAGEEAAEFLALMRKAAQSAKDGESTADFARSLGLGKGITGYALHTVPCVVQCWLRNQADYRAAIIEIVRCGGDTDTAAAILGGIVGTRVGAAGIPADWLENLVEWPRSVDWMKALGARLAEVAETGQPQPALLLFPLAVVARNLFFLAVVLAHGFRRLLPPY